MLNKPLNFSHKVLQDYVTLGDYTIDATVGNGKDTVKLAALVGPHGKVFGYDIQSQAIKETQNKLTLTGLSEPVRLFHRGHENLATDLADFKNQIQASVFNLGYLPKGDKNLITKADTTLKALKACLNLTKRGGIVLIMVYSGHQGGKEEKEAVLDFVQSLNQDEYSVLRYEFINQINAPPFLLAIEKR